MIPAFSHRSGAMTCFRKEDKPPGTTLRNHSYRGFAAPMFGIYTRFPCSAEQEYVSGP